MIRVTADTNILVSGTVYARGNPRRLLQMALAGDINLTVSQWIIDEMADVLRRKFDATPGNVAEARGIIAAAARIVRPSVQLDIVKEDPSDNRILECAVSAGSDYLVTGDKDLLRLEQYDSIRILSVSNFLDVVRGQGRGGSSPEPTVLYTHLQKASAQCRTAPLCASPPARYEQLHSVAVRRMSSVRSGVDNENSGFVVR
ncbi:MAG TPA: putative toxin-antitoxin system toxin component, PIN family [Terriglobia bacterium]|nr:putative toxin-antitoxin system toxin component, PIN family [Terriglobia bacterium]